MQLTKRKSKLKPQLRVNKQKKYDFRFIQIPLDLKQSKPQNFVDRFKIKNTDMDKLRKLRAKSVKKKSTSKYWFIFEKFYNKNPFESMTLFKNLSSRGVCEQEGKRSILKTKHPFKKNQGVFFNNANFINFFQPPRRLREKFKLDKKSLEYSSKVFNRFYDSVNENIKAKALSKRSSQEFKKQKATHLFQYKKTPFDKSHSFFGSSKSESNNQHKINVNFLVRSLDDVDKIMEIFSPKEFQSVKGNYSTGQNQIQHTFNEFSKESFEIIKLLKQIQIFDLKNPSDSVFREKVLDLCREFSKKKR